MDVNKAVTLYCGISEVQQVNFLSRLAHQITIFARDTYTVDSDSLSDPALLRCINEILHRVLGQQFKLLLGDHNRYPDDVFIKMIVGMAEDCHFGEYLYSGIIDSFNFAEKLGSDTILKAKPD